MTIKGSNKRRRTNKHRNSNKSRRTNKHKRTSNKRRHTRNKRGGGLPGISPMDGSPAAPFGGNWGGNMKAFPPGPMYSPGVNNDATYYGKLNAVIAPPINSHGSGVTKKGGRKYHRKTQKKKKKKKKKINRGRKKKGGSISQILSNNLPGFSDIRDVYWKGGEVLTDKYNTWVGLNDSPNPSVTDQPIGKNNSVVRPVPVDVSTHLESGALQAKKFTDI
uniref:Uncharacterized protein n=1 Tax=viral metagenome TaxID=1070528 RepID=A0A6C0C780_9ZZZZ